MSVQTQATTKAIAKVTQVNNAPANNNQTAIALSPTPDASNTIPAIVSNPTVSIILAFAILVRVIVDRSPSGKK